LAPGALSDSIESQSALGFRFYRIFRGKPVSTPDHVRGRLFPENALSGHDLKAVTGRLDHRLERLAKEIVVAEPAVTIGRKRRVIEHLIVEIEPAEPAVDRRS
jgi:hypothetical protein